jgi:hypothetical protein
VLVRSVLLVVGATMLASFSLLLPTNVTH